MVLTKIKKMEKYREAARKEYDAVEKKLYREKDKKTYVRRNTK